MQNAILVVGLLALVGLAVFGAFNASSGFTNLVIEEIRFREATGGPDIDEWVVIANRTGQQVDLSNWKIESATGPRIPPSIGQTFFFPQGCVLPPGGRVYVHSGPVLGGGTLFRSSGKQSTPCGQQRLDHYVSWSNQRNSPQGWWQGTPDIENTVWSNDGDTAWLLNRSGGGLFVYERVDSCSYTGNESNGLKICR